jgi:hypothetical protein
LSAVEGGAPWRASVERRRSMVGLQNRTEREESGGSPA